MASVFSRLPVEERPRHLAYVEWFSPFAQRPDPESRQFSVSRSYDGPDRLCSIVDVRRIVRSVHLVPRCRGPIPPEWASNNVLELCRSFWVNDLSDRNLYNNLK